MTSAQRVDGYVPLADYGIIGDCRSAALVSSDGSIDWLCLPRFDHPSIFGRILDARRGGFWQIRPRGPYRVHQRYRDRSNILETIFTTRTGRVVVSDFMPLEHGRLEEHARPHTEARLVRIVDCVAGEMTLHQDVVPAVDYGTGDCPFSDEDGRYHGDSDKLHVCIRTTSPCDLPHGTLTVREGEAIALGLISSRRGHCPKRRWTLERARQLLQVTRDFWWEWVNRSHSYDGPYREPVIRSALVLKLMTYSPTGAIVAAPTTSLPEHIGGRRNWDYRFTWLRDASFTLYAFFQLGLVDEAAAFFRWLAGIGIGLDGRRVQNLYDLDGRTSGEERELDWLHGYRGSAPVRVGNAAATQLQLDVYGEVLDSAYLFARFGGEISRDLWRELAAVVEMTIDGWEQPDASIWEVRGENLQYTYSKLMCWVAVDRGLRIAERFRLPHDRLRWRRARTAIKRRILREAWSEKRQAFAQSFGSDVLDAAVLRMSQVRFLRDTDPRLVSTARAIAHELGHGVLVNRYSTQEHSDGVGGPEGAFFMCSFWLVDALAHMGDVASAERIFDRLLTFGSPLGLFSEECDVRTGELLGNFPQAFTHLALVGAAVNIERARRGEMAPRGLRRNAHIAGRAASVGRPPRAPRTRPSA